MPGLTRPLSRSISKNVVDDGDLLRNDGSDGEVAGTYNAPVLPALGDLSEATASPVEDLTNGPRTFMLPPPNGDEFLSAQTDNDNWIILQDDVAEPSCTPSATVDRTVSAVETTQCRGGQWNDDGTEFIACMYEDNELKTVANEGTAYYPAANELDGAATATRDTSTTDSLTQPFGCSWTDDGSKLVVAFRMGSDAASVLALYTLSTPYDLSTASLDHTQGLTGVRGVAINGNGTRMFVTRKGVELIEQYNLGTAWDLTSLGSPITSLDWTTIRTSASHVLQGLNWHDPSGTLLVTSLINATADTYTYIFR